MSLFPPYQMDGGQLLDEAEGPAGQEAARRYFELEPFAWLPDVLADYDLPTEEDAFREFLDEAHDRKSRAVTDREHLLALVELLRTEGPEAVAQYVDDTVRNWVF